MSGQDKCFACDKKLGASPRLVDTRDDQTVLVGSECFKLIAAAGARGYQPPKGGPRLWPLGTEAKNRDLSKGQRDVLADLDAYIPIKGDNERGWKTTRLYDPRTVRSLISRGLVTPSSSVAWMIKDNLNDMTIKISPLGQEALRKQSARS